jgi:hypothetical protein
MAANSASEYRKSPPLGRMMGNTGMDIFSLATLSEPYEGVVPPSRGFSQSSILPAPASAACRAEGILKVAISSIENQKSENEPVYQEKNS